VLAERHAHLAYQGQHARIAAQDPDVAKEIQTLVAKTAHRLKQDGADATGLLTALATELYVMGRIDGSAEDRPGMADATLATIIKLEGIERKIRQEAERKIPQEADRKIRQEAEA
jgi:hypothetical protein